MGEERIDEDLRGKREQTRWMERSSVVCHCGKTRVRVCTCQCVRVFKCVCSLLWTNWCLNPLNESWTVDSPVFGLRVCVGKLPKDFTLMGLV